MLENKKHVDHDVMVNSIVSICYHNRLLGKTDKVVVTSGHILAKRGSTNIVEIYTVDNILDRMK